MKTYNEYKESFEAFDKKYKLEDYFSENVYFNVFFRYLDILVNKLIEVENPEHEWNWIKCQYKKGREYLELCMAMEDLVDEQALGWTYEQMRLNLSAGKRICQMFFNEGEEPEWYMPEAEIARRRHNSLFKRICRFVSFSSKILSKMKKRLKIFAYVKKM